MTEELVGYLSGVFRLLVGLQAYLDKRERTWAASAES